MTPEELQAIPADLRAWHRWVLWRNESRNDKPTKLPFYMPDDETGIEQPAKSNDPSTWMPFDHVVQLLEDMPDKWKGIGFVFEEGSGFLGIDLDGCVNAQTGKVEPWAREIIKGISSYTEYSPSGTGVKIFMRGKSPFDKGKNRKIDAPKVSDKDPGIEIYDKLRYFAVTGRALKGYETLAGDQQYLDQLCKALDPPLRASIPGTPMTVIDRARRYMSTLEPAISGSGGHNITFRAACKLVVDFALTVDQAMPLMLEYNDRCKPPWSEHELRHKLEDANKEPGARGRLLDSNIESAALDAGAKSTPVITSSDADFIDIADAMQASVDRRLSGEDRTISTGIKTLDWALSGGVQRGEMVVLGMLTSHGKSAMAMQMVHEWTYAQMPALVISQEMAAHRIGTRTIQYMSPISLENWDDPDAKQALDFVIAHRRQQYAPCKIIECVRDVRDAISRIETAVEKFGVQCVVIDYLQLIKADGHSKRDQVASASTALRDIAKKHNLVLVALVQLNRAIETRTNDMIPKVSDILESGQIGQDADVIVLGLWPWKIDSKKASDPSKYMLVIHKNRNREIRDKLIEITFDPEHMMFSDDPSVLEEIEHREAFPSMPRIGPDGMQLSNFDPDAWLQPA